MTNSQLIIRVVLLLAISEFCGYLAADDCETRASPIRYRSFVWELKSLDVKELVELIDKGTTHERINAAFALGMSDGLGNHSSEKPFSFVKRQMENAALSIPTWYGDTLDKAGLTRLGEKLVFDIPKLKKYKREMFFSHCAPAQRLRPQLRILEAAVVAERFPLDLEPNGRERFIAFDVSPESEVAVRYVYTPNNLGHYLVACDGAGIRWVQRVFRWYDSTSGELNENCCAEVRMNANHVCLFGLSTQEFIFEQFDVSTGEPTVRLNSKFFQLTKPD